MAHRTRSATPDYPTGTGEAPPGYATSARYTIGRRTLQSPLVRNVEVKAHLSLLLAITALRRSVEGLTASQLPHHARTLNANQRWGLAIHLAVERFQRWICVVKPAPLQRWIQEEMPPIDVLMVWHSYMLNPAWYAEDCSRLPILAVLRKLKTRLVDALVEIADLGAHQVSEARKATWLEQTETPFDLIDAFASLTHRDLRCPRCLEMMSVPFVTSEGTGYAQHRFSARCPSCPDFEFGREHLAMRKLVREFVRDHLDLEDVERYGKGVYLAGTLRTPRKAEDDIGAGNVNSKLHRAHPLAPPYPSASSSTWQQHIIDATGFSMNRMKAAMAIVLFGGSRRVQRVMSAYSDDRPFSVDLVGAVIRQYSFIEKMDRAGWTIPGYFDDPDDEVILTQAICRYHAFLDLLSTAPLGMFVPTLDIDLVWHTHQLMAELYNDDCMEYLGRFIDHNDKVEENYLSSSFDVTCRAWRERFGVPYSYCGCPLPGDKLSEKFNRLKQKLSRNTKAAGNLAQLDRPDATFGTHASDHNAYVEKPSFVEIEPIRQGRIEKIRKRQERDSKRESKATKKDVGVAEGGKATMEHDPAFLYPVPFFEYHSDAACVATSASSHGLGCSVGAGACGGGKCGAGCIGGGGIGGGTGARPIGIM